MGKFFQSLGILKSIEFTSWENLSLKYLGLNRNSSKKRALRLYHLNLLKVTRK